MSKSAFHTVARQSRGSELQDDVLGVLQNMLKSIPGARVQQEVQLPHGFVVDLAVTWDEPVLNGLTRTEDGDRYAFNSVVRNDGQVSISSE